MKMSQTRSNRWNRRSSDGRVASSSDSFHTTDDLAAAAASIGFDENSSVASASASHRQKEYDHPQRTTTTTTNTNTTMQHKDATLQHGGGVNVKPIINQSSILITEEFNDRVVASSLASTVTFVTLSLLILTGQGTRIIYTEDIRHVLYLHQLLFLSILFFCITHSSSLSLSKDILPVAWIGNVIAISTLKATLGDTLLTAQEIFLPLIPVAMISWGILVLLLGSLLRTEIQSILLPVVVMMGSMCIILCPYLTMKNLSLVIFYLVVASPLSLRYSGKFDESNDDEIVVKDLGTYFVPGLVGTCTAGLILSVLAHIMVMTLLPRSTTSATHLSHRLVNQLTYETQQLFTGVSEYTQNIGISSNIARQSRTLIEFYVKKRQKTLTELENCLPALRAERYWTTSEHIAKAECFVAYSKKQQKHAELIRLATTQQFLGEEFTSQNNAVRNVKTKMSTNLGFAVEQIAQEYVKSERSFLFDNKYRQGDVTISHNLEQCMDTYKKAMRQAISDAETDLLNNDAASRSSTGPLIRQRVAFLGLFSFVVELHDAITNTKSETSGDTSSSPSMYRQITSTLKKPRLWKDRGKRRHAIKTALGMTLASAWISIPYLREHISYPNSIWVGLTVASVNLENTGASYIKCIDRLWGTLIAGGYAILIGKVFDHTNGLAILSFITMFTFISMFLTNHDRPYASQYAATSVGSILFGSLDFKLAVDEFVPTRVMLIFVGVVTVLVIELLVLPRSSRTIVQGHTLQFFEDLEYFLFDASKACGSISSIHSCSSNKDEHQAMLARDDPLWMFREGQATITLAEDLVKSLENVTNTVSMAKSELPFGLSEPSVGLNISLDIIGYEFLLTEQAGILTQLDLLMTTIKSLIGFYSHLPENHPVRSLHWPALLSAGILQLAQHLSKCTDELRRVFPHGLCRPGACQVSQIIRAVAVFRTFEDVILTILSEAEDRHATYLHSIESSGGAVRYTPGFRLTLALAESAILTIGQRLSQCGQYLETIVQSFPVEQFKLDVEIEQHSLAIITEQDDSG